MQYGNKLILLRTWKEGFGTVEKTRSSSFVIVQRSNEITRGSFAQQNLNDISSFLYCLRSDEFSDFQNRKIDVDDCLH